MLLMPMLMLRAALLTLALTFAAIDFHAFAMPCFHTLPPSLHAISMLIRHAAIDAAVDAADVAAADAAAFLPPPLMFSPLLSRRYFAAAAADYFSDAYAYG